MRNYNDQDTADTKGANKNTLLTGETVKAEPAPPSEAKAEEPKAKPVRRIPVVVKQKEEKPATPPNVQSRNSIELIEGAKRRDGQIQ